MRIIAGKLKGRNIEVPKNALRPTLDRTKETLFNILQFQIEGKNVLDLFAGSGALGLEAYSRGAESVTFVDNDNESIECIKRNCAKCKCTAEIIRADYLQAIKSVNTKFDIVFVDPPYKSDYYSKACQTMCDYGILAENCIVVLEHSIQNQMPDTIGGLEKYREKKMGKMTFSFYTQKITEEKQ